MVELFSSQACHRAPSWATTAVLLSLSVVVAGCTTMQSVEMSSDALRTAVRAGEVGRPGQQVVVVTADGEQHAFTYQSVDTAQDVVRGEAASGEAVAVPIEDIVALRMQATDGGRTAMVVIGALLVVALAIGYDAADAIGDGLVDLVGVW